MEKRAAQPTVDANANPWGLGSATDPWFFCIGLLGERYAFEARCALEVIRLGPLTRLPSSPAFLPGVLNHRGEILAVLDVGILLCDRPTALSAGSRAAVVQSGPYRLALIADAVEGLVQIPEAELGPPPAGGTAQAEFVSRVGRDAKGTVVIFDLDRLIDSARAKSAA